MITNKSEKRISRRGFQGAGLLLPFLSAAEPLPNIMKLATVITVAVILSHPSPAQTLESGVYLTTQDFLEKKLSYASPCGKEHTIKLNEFLGKPFITLKHKGSTVKLMKDSIFAFVDCEGIAHRFYKKYDSDYLIEEAKALTIYSREENVSTSKGFKVQKEYFFSTALSGELIPLEPEKLKMAFPQNHELHDAIDQFFPQGNGITDFDKIHKEFKVNHFLTKYIK